MLTRLPPIRACLRPPHSSATMYEIGSGFDFVSIYAYAGFRLWLVHTNHILLCRVLMARDSFFSWLRERSIRIPNDYGEVTMVVSLPHRDGNAPDFPLRRLPSSLYDKAFIRNRVLHAWLHDLDFNTKKSLCFSWRAFLLGLVYWVPMSLLNRCLISRLLDFWMVVIFGNYRPFLYCFKTIVFWCTERTVGVGHGHPRFLHNAIDEGRDGTSLATLLSLRVVESLLRLHSLGGFLWIGFACSSEDSYQKFLSYLWGFVWTGIVCMCQCRLDGCQRGGTISSLLCRTSLHGGERYLSVPTWNSA